MKILYFSWLRQKLGRSEEEFTLTPDVLTVADLVAVLRRRGGAYADVFDDSARLRAAVNQEHVRPDAKLENAAEVAFFPPVTGG